MRKSLSLTAVLVPALVFLQGGGSTNRRVAGGDGAFLIAPWDYQFSDNFGFYRLEALVKRGTGKPPDVEVE
jgi:hypothetical protein